MEHHHTIHGLLRKRQEVTDAISAAQDRVRSLTQDIDAIDRTLGLFGVTQAPVEGRIRPLPLSRHPSQRNDQSRLLLALLRERGESTLRELVDLVIEARGLSADQDMHSLMRKRIGCSLRHLRAQAVVTSDGDARTGVVWRVAN